jgi:hypothetical protein
MTEISLSTQKDVTRDFLESRGKISIFLFKTYRRRGNSDDKIVPSMASMSQAIDRCFFSATHFRHYCDELSSLL